jgi:hypothetical protein
VLRSRRGILAIVTVGMLLVMGMGAAAAFWKLHLPDPEQADGGQLLRWLVARDLEGESPDLRHRLAVRLEQEFGMRPVHWAQIGDKLNENRCDRMWKNLGLLLEPFLDEKLDRYRELPAADRVAFVDSLLDELDNWRQLEAIRPAAAVASATQGAGPGLSALVLTRVRQWQDQAPPQRRAQIDPFLFTVQARWLWRTIMPKASHAS